MQIYNELLSSFFNYGVGCMELEQKNGENSIVRFISWQTARNFYPSCTLYSVQGMM